jgi:hypothetical protein
MGMAIKIGRLEKGALFLAKYQYLAPDLFSEHNIL